MKGEPEGHHIRLGGRRFHYLAWGSPGLPVVVLLHGIADSAHVWDLFARSCQGAFRILAMDQRGHGQTDWAVPPAYGGAEYVADLQAFLDHLSLPRVILMGHSMGALHATRYAALQPERVCALIHVDIEPRPPDWNRKYLCNLHRDLPHAYETISDYVDLLFENSPWADRAVLAQIAPFNLSRGADGLFHHRFDREVLRHFDAYDLIPHLPAITCPVLVVRGTDSSVLPLQSAMAMCQSLPLGQMAEVEGAAHPVHTDNPRAFQRVVRRFLEGQGLMAASAENRP